MPIAWTNPNHRLFTATSQAAKFIVFNTDTGKAVTSPPVVGVNSDMSLMSRVNESTSLE